VGLNFNSSKAICANIITKEACLTLINISSLINNGKYPTFVNLVILNPTITVTLMAKFNPTITAYLVPYMIERHDNKIFCYWVSLLLKVEHISYTMGTRTLPDIYTLALGPVTLRQLHIYQAKHSCPYIHNAYCRNASEICMRYAH